jgi:hypothetical protein
MKKLMLGLTTALALGAMAVPDIASAAEHHGGGHVSMSRCGGGGIARNFVGNRGIATRSFKSNRNFANVRSSRNVVTTQSRSLSGRNFARTNNGQRWAWNGRHHRHNRGWWLPGLALGSYGLYSAYDNCWDTVWTPSGYQRVYVCGPDNYNYY